MSPPAWSRLIRFTSSDVEGVQYGEPVASDYVDIGKLADDGKLRAKIIAFDRTGPLSETARVTDREVSVNNLLGPLGLDTCTDIKCIGLNYKRHSQSTFCREVITPGTDPANSTRGRQKPSSTPTTLHQAGHLTR